MHRGKKVVNSCTLVPFRIMCTCPSTPPHSVCSTGLRLACVNTSDVCAGIVGEIDEGGDGYYIWTHKKFDIGYNGKQIVDVNLTSESKVKLEPNIKISFSYEVSRISISVSLCIAHQAVYFASQILMTVLLSLIVHYCMNKIHDQKDHAGGGGGGVWFKKKI